MAVTLEDLGLSQEQLQDRVVDKLCHDMMHSFKYDGDPEADEESGYWDGSEFKKALDQRVKAAIDAKVDALAAVHVLPNVAQFIENLTLTETNQWGEKKGNPVTFVEYLVERAQQYMQEQVDNDGKSKRECGNYHWNARESRITNLIHRHLQYAIDTAMKSCLESANKSIVGGIEAAVRAKLTELSAQIQASVKVGR